MPIPGKPWVWHTVAKRLDEAVRRLVRAGPIERLGTLRAHLNQPLPIIRDGRKVHRGKPVRESLDSTDGDIQMALLPPYWPDPNLVEKPWASLERPARASFCLANVDEPDSTACATLRSAQP